MIGVLLFCLFYSIFMFFASAPDLHESEAYSFSRFIGGFILVSIFVFGLIYILKIIGEVFNG